MMVYTRFPLGIIHVIATAYYTDTDVAPSTYVIRHL